jgi:hypothetical protein
MFIFDKIFGQEHMFETCLLFPWEITLQGTFYDNLFDFKKKFN